MRNWCRMAGLTMTAGLATLSMALLVGCADDLYSPCTLDPGSPDIAIATCGANDGIARSCVVENQLQCDTRACGRYQGSEPFCTKKCGDDSDCPSGTCLELVFQSGQKYCVQDELL